MYKILKTVPDFVPAYPRLDSYPTELKSNIETRGLVVELDDFLQRLNL